MSTLVHKTITRTGYSKVVSLAKLVAVTGLAQAAIQGLGFLSGVLIIRLLPTHEYALYTLATAMLTNMVIIADSGVKASVLAEGGKVWQDKQQLGEVLVTGIQLRKWFATASFILAAPVMLYLLRHHGASWFVAIGIVLAVLPAFYATLTCSVLEIVPRLHQKVLALQKIDIKGNAIRVVLVCGFLFALPVTVVAVAAMGVAQLWISRQMKQVAATFYSVSAKPSAAIRAKMLAMVSRLLPESLYLCVSGPIMLWLISVFGSTAAVAQLGALGRFSIVMAFINILFGTLVSPRFSRLQASKKVLLKRYCQVQVLLFTCVAGISLFTWLFASELLWVLGPGYSGLEYELTLMMFGNAVGLCVVLTFSLCTSRGWVINPAVSIPVSLGSILLGASLFEVSTLEGVFAFNVLNNAIMLVLHTGYGFYSIAKN